MDAPLRLLVIEDNQADFLLLQRHLKRQGLRALCTRIDSMVELESALTGQRWDAILADYNVPGMVFGQSMDLIRSRQSDLPVILVTGALGEEKAVDLLKQGCADFVLKENLARLVPAIERSLSEVAEHQARREAEEALREADRRKDEFLAMLAHELRNPLAPISNAVQIMKLPGLDEARLAWCRDIIDRQVDHLVHLVDDLLDISRISRGKIELKKEPVEMSAIVQRAVEASHPLIEAHRHEFSVQLPPEAIYVEGDLVRLSQVVANLLNNAAKYTDEGGHIDLSIEPVDNDILIRVRDDGRGIEPSALTGLFELFYQVDSTLDRSEGGLGIGLALVKSLVTMHGGDVWATSDGLGQGSEFVIRLPRLPQSPAIPVSYQAASKSDKGSLRILVVDDNRDTAQSLSLLLTSEGHEVLLAYDGYTALEVALAKQPQVVLLDIGLPRMNGYAVARALRQHPDMKRAHLIALSGYGREVDREQAKAAGFNSYLTKPVDFDELQCVLNPPATSL